MADAMNLLLMSALSNPLTGDTNYFWLLPAAGVALILVILLVILGKKKPPND